MKILSLLKTEPLKRFAALERQLTELEKPRAAYSSYDKRLSDAINSAQRAFEANPTADTLASLHGAIASQKSFVACDIWKKKIEDVIYERQSTLKRTPDTLAIYVSCLEEIRDGLKNELAATRSRLTTALKAEGDDAPNVDAIPAVQRLLSQVADVESAIARIGMNPIFTDNDIMRIFALIRGQLQSPAVAPAPVPARQGMITEAEELRRKFGAKGPPVDPRPENRRSLLPEAWIGRHRMKQEGGQMERVEVPVPNAAITE